MVAEKIKEMRAPAAWFQIPPKRLSGNPSNMCICHSERSEESHGFKGLHLRDSAARASE